MIRRVPRPVLAALLAAATALMFTAPSAAHSTGVHKITLTPGTQSSARSTTFNHGTFTLKVVAYFGKVTRTTAYVDKVTITTCPDVVIMGGPFWLYNNKDTYKYMWDAGLKYTSCGTFTQQVDKTFTGGYVGGNVAVTFEKHNSPPKCDPFDCEIHISYATFYVPPS